MRGAFLFCIPFGSGFLCNFAAMKQRLMIYVFLLTGLLFISQLSTAQCSICTKTAQQLGEGPAKGLNSGILYLAFMPMIIVGVIGYRWWRSNRND